MASIHVRPRQDGRWIVELEGAGEALSEHPEATEAAGAAGRHARVLDPEEIVLHDRYHCVHVIHGPFRGGGGGGMADRRGMVRA